ncbi:RCC1 domain-containing protein 1-like [Microplitis mediator]|uniref:RCC1 domain-containing protein 1-like n=1 Tax=Microplitis mediator TaxID=375433 RepID=UPI002556D8F8|nr:RCC1 domain-containing protein 1-like [Microplitis mediator]
MFYYAGFNVNPSIISSHNESPVVDKFSKVTIDGITDITIGWNYFLIWKKNTVFLSEKYITNEANLKELSIPGQTSTKFISGIAGKFSITLMSTDKEIWRYKLYSNEWKKVDNFIANDEFVVKIDEANHSIVALTNFGRVYNIPNLVEMPPSFEKSSRCTDIACGFEHTLMLTNNGEVYSSGGGSRGQLGHDDLENSDEPSLIEALTGLIVIKIAAGGWHNAVITSDNDLYTWGWNTNGELGLINSEKVVAVPTIVDFYDDDNKRVIEDIKVRDVHCGNNFTVCVTDDGQLWGCGSNKYGQLGLAQFSGTSKNKFVKLNVNLHSKNINYVKCREWSTIINVR